MKRNTGFATMLLAVFMLLMVPYIPHHHHNGAICTATEHCNDDNADNDRHTKHDGDTSLCIEDEEYLISTSDSLHDSLKPHCFSILAATINPIVCGDIVLTDFHAHDYAAMARYHSADIVRIRALRAPPCLFK
ncbi:MAG: hypothetical protein NC113_10020 [Bacteroides sp.]|nr:hypothetical protein [Bacteroides sp.]MCM1448531.1 hypothetical protein [Bacteroides sp.]